MQEALKNRNIYIYTHTYAPIIFHEFTIYQVNEVSTYFSAEIAVYILSRWSYKEWHENENICLTLIFRRSTFHFSLAGHLYHNAFACVKITAGKCVSFRIQPIFNFFLMLGTVQIIGKRRSLIMSEQFVAKCSDQLYIIYKECQRMF